VTLKISIARGKNDDTLNALTNTDEVGKLIGGVAFPATLPLVESQDNVIEPKALLAHVQEPHCHRTGPQH
jgi:hypothetical protein